jgi:hypothetical protein
MSFILSLHSIVLSLKRPSFYSIRSAVWGVFTFKKRPRKKNDISAAAFVFRLTLTVAVWRFIMIRYHTLASTYCTMTRCHLLILLAYGNPKIHLLHTYWAVRREKYPVAVFRNFFPDWNQIPRKISWGRMQENSVGFDFPRENVRKIDVSQ